MGEGRGGEKKKVLLTSLGAEARFSLSALAVGILESCSQILQSPSWATPWLQVTASVMARRRWAAAPSTRSTFNGAARQWPTFLAAPSPPSPGAQVYAGGTPASSGRPRGLAAQLRTSKPARIFLLLKKKNTNNKPRIQPVILAEGSLAREARGKGNPSLPTEPSAWAAGEPAPPRRRHPALPACRSPSRLSIAPPAPAWAFLPPSLTSSAADRLRT